jgi:hypothetical protein
MSGALIIGLNNLNIFIFTSRSVMSVPTVRILDWVTIYLLENI